MKQKKLIASSLALIILAIINYTALSAPNISALFSSCDAIQEQLISLIQQEHKKIQIAVFRLSDKQIAQALIEQKNKGITIEIITDSGGLDSRITKILLLHQAKIPIFIYPTNSTNQGLMHHKFCLFFENSSNSEQIVWTGSYNFSQAANTKNQENVIIARDITIFSQYCKAFSELKALCLPL